MFKFGVCYYPEHWPEERWESDAQQMVEAGIEIVRIAEFAWALMEPADGHFEWAWLDQAIEVLGRCNLRVMLGTPTATPPIWLSRAYPEILRVDANGRRRDHGSRRHYCPNSPIYRRHSLQIVSAMLQRYAQNRHVFSWQIDNEWGGGHTARCYCANCTAAFQTWLEARYGDIAGLNKAWGTIFWSQTYDSWPQIGLPDQAIDKPNPSQLLDFYRFSSDSYVAYQKEQVDLLRRHAPGQLVTSNFMGLYRDLDPFDLADDLDFVSWDSYPTGNLGRWRDHLYMEGDDSQKEVHDLAYDVGDPYVTGMAHALTYGLKRQPFWIMEQQAGAINWSKYNSGIRPGTTRLWTWHALAEGADTVVFFRWRATLFAQEQYHSGLLQHDGSPGVGHDDLMVMKDELQLMGDLAGRPNKAHTALLVNFDDLWALEIQPHRDDYTYLKHLFVTYRACRQLGIEVDIIASSADFDEYRLILAPTLHIVDEGLASRLKAYVEKGGSLLLGVRSGFKTKSNLVTDRPLPGLLKELTGATVVRWQSIPDKFGWELTSDVQGLSGSANWWVECLRPDDDSIRIRASYSSGPYAGSAAMTENTIGKGCVCTQGWYPTAAQARSTIAHLAARVNIAPIGDLPRGLLAQRRGDSIILLNFTESPQTAVISGQSVSVPARELSVVNLPASEAYK